jgi:uncharacterized protein YndB with AHSA1/START domain
VPADPSSTDRIEKQIHLSATRARVWRALTDSSEFGRWFGVDLSGVVAPGEQLRGPLTSRGYEPFTFEATVETVEPDMQFSFRWPAARRAKAFEMNSNGWQAQMVNIKRYVAA